MLGSTIRQRRVTSINATTSGFHIVRVQEFMRDNLFCKLESTKEISSQSYFVQTLQAICAERLSKDFAKMPEIDTLQNQEPYLYAMVLSCLPEPVNASNASLPLHVCVERVSEESYWKRCCMSRWSLGQLSAFLGNDEQLLNRDYGWKQLYLEHFLSDFLLSLRGRIMKCPPSSQPVGLAQNVDLHGGDIMWASEDDLQALADLCTVCRDYVITVELPYQFTHLNWYNHLFSMLPHARKFRLSYGVSNAGTEYEPFMVGFTQDDAENVRHLLIRHPFEKLRLPNTRLFDSHTMAICAGLANNKSIRVLDLSHNTIGDSSMRDALAVLLAQPGFPLEALYLDDNNIGAEGARALAEALEVNELLQILHLDQNQIPDRNAGDVLVRALGKTSALRELHLGSNALGPLTAAALTEVLPHLRALRSLNLAGNCRLGGGYSEKSIADLSESEALLAADKFLPSETVPDTPQQPENSGDHCEAVNEDNKKDQESEHHLQEFENTEDGFVSMLSLSNRDVDPNESNDRQEKDVEEEVAVAVAPSLPILKISATGPGLLKAIHSNSSLRYVDVRRCGFTTNEEQAIERAVRDRLSSR